MSKLKPNTNLTKAARNYLKADPSLTIADLKGRNTRKMNLLAQPVG